ncbi:serine/threonine protein kinase [Actinoplanes sp. SE50]|uniref:serine/threonine-protein kinase n=1 Tax=unclassified Actinoplanes TaxID=2626549 RepID=UPI00023EDD81|nr:MULTISPECIES: serine/threonine-protein kinase [unclassified Actinoplanes]AEV88619.1 Serine/threonine protein kinase [Actinoplanes sp. SE50/110]ATO87023.1 serine/threonine protein kinase [Actinoplanes sp. SE50]SLM04441.1 serine/threonine protein kinase [Actinoplanes sp. SE50/110]
MTQIPTWSSGDAASLNGRAAPGTLIGGRYTLRAAVGHGGMGTVWRAADTLLRRDVAIKEVILPPGLAPSDRDAMYERTMREARAAAALQHPAVVQVYDVVHENGRPWIVMELLDARSLADMVIEDGPVAPRVVAKIGIALLGALEVAHAHGVLHRDVKPANVLICNDGRCVLTDFGVARMPTDVQLTTPGMVLGSPHFISPERAMGQDFGPPSDLFSLGVTLYTAIEGRPPFDKGDPIETMHAVVEDPPAPVMRAGSLTPVLMGLLEKNPAQRMDVQTARTLLRQQLAGPLASKSPPHMMTDPYSVVPSPRPVSPPPAATQQIPPQPSGQIGGRAMLAPGESLTDHLTKLEQQNSTGGGRRRAPEPADAGFPTGTMPAHQLPQATRPGTVVTSPAAKRRMAVQNATQTVKDATARARATFLGWPRNKRLAVGGGAAAAVLALILIVSLTGGGDGGAAVQTPVAGPQTGAAAPGGGVAAGTQDYKGSKAISVKVPAGWTRAAGGTYVDYVDPADKLRKVRVLAESGKSTPEHFVTEIAPNGLKKSANCPKPFKAVGTDTNLQISGHPAAQLEYTCGTGDAMRHGIWRMTQVNGTMYSFFLTTPAAEFDGSRKYFDAMADSFQLNL